MSADTTTAPPPAEAARPAPPRLDRLPPYRVLLHNDDVTPMDWVVKTLVLLTPLSRFAALRVMLTAHNTGAALVRVTHRERAELYRDQCASRGLKASIEPGQ